MHLTYQGLILAIISLCAVSSANTANDERPVVTLSEVTVKPKDKAVLYTSGYMREYSSLRTYRDTVFLYREKTVDFMLPTKKAGKFKGWRTPRLLASRSYYQFTDQYGLDSVSNNFNIHFSWSDWMEIPSGISLSKRLTENLHSSDTVRNKYNRISQIWHRNYERLGVHINVLNDTLNRRWMRRLTGPGNRGVDFGHLEVDCIFEDVDSDSITPEQITDYFFHIESLGRGYDMRLSGGRKPAHIETIGELYITDKRYISVKEAERLSKKPHEVEDKSIVVPERAIALPDEINRLISRVEQIDHDQIRLQIVPDQRLAGFDDLFKTRHSFWEDLLSTICPPRYFIKSSVVPSGR